jgi:hypothetical protein
MPCRNQIVFELLFLCTLESLCRFCQPFFVFLPFCFQSLIWCVVCDAAARCIVFSMAAVGKLAGGIWD